MLPMASLSDAMPAYRENRAFWPVSCMPRQSMMVENFTAFAGILPAAERPKVMQETVRSDKHQFRAAARPKVMQETV